MADISNEIKIFREAVYGEEVRGGFISLAEKMNEVSEATETAEKKRVTAETGRVNAEKIRVSQETDRKNAETDRVSAETARASAESTRTSQESTRKSAETGRTNAEKNRVTQEEARKTAEKARASAETFRANAEKARGTAETGRVNAEQKRQTDTGSAIESCNTATDRANKAAQEAREATDKADAAAENIKEKIGINDKQPSDVTTYSGNKIEEMAQTNWIPTLDGKFKYQHCAGNYEKGKLTIKTTDVSGSQYAYFELKNLKPNTTYTISWNSSRTGEIGGGVGVLGRNGSAYTTLNNTKTNTINDSCTFNTGNHEAISFNLYCGNQNSHVGDSATFSGLMLVEGVNKSNYMENVRDIVQDLANIKASMQWIATAGYKTIAANTNLDSLSEKGIYCSIASNITSTLSGKPSDLRYGFVMRVMEITGNKFLVQEIEENVTRKVYRRVFENGVYKDWVTLLDTSDLVANLTTTVTGKVLDALMGKKLKDEIDALNSTLVALKGYFKNEAVDAKTFSDDVLNLYKKTDCMLVPFRTKFSKDLSPTKTENWFRGYVVFQNNNYNYGEIGNIVAHSSAGSYSGLIKTNSGNNPIIVWKLLTAY